MHMRKKIKSYKKRNIKTFKKFKLYSYVTIGNIKKELKYHFQLHAAVDNNYNVDYFAKYNYSGSTAGGTPAFFYPSGTTGYVTSNLVFANAYADYGPPLILPFNYMLGAGIGNSSIGNTFSQLADNYKYYQIKAATVKIDPLAVSGTGGQAYSTNATPVIIPTMQQFLSQLPVIYINASDNVGHGILAGTAASQQSAGTFNNYDDSWNTWTSDGQPQRDKGSLRFLPSNTAHKTSLKRTFAFGSWCMPTQQVYAGQYATMNAIGHWCRTYNFGANDPATNAATYQMGAIVLGSYPRLTIATPAQNTNYQNQSLLVADLEVTLLINFMGETDYISNAQA